MALERAYDIERSHFPDDIMAQAQSLLQAGYTLRSIERALRAAFPGRATPSHTTIGEWDRVLAASLQEESLPREQRIIAQADDLIATGLTQLSDDPDKILKHLMTLNAIQGTFRDKQIKRNDTGTNVQVNVLVQQATERLQAQLE